jgi:hypothetical protein
MGDKKGMILGGCGFLMSATCFVSVLFWSFLVAQDSGGIDAEEAFPGVLSSCCCLFISMAITGGGIFMAVKAKKAAAAAPPPQA